MTVEHPPGRSGIPSPWQNRDPWPAGAGHDPETCPTCAPIRGAAFRVGATRAAALAEPR